MPKKRVLFQPEAHEKLLRGAGKLADAVRLTLGPKSKCVLIAKSWGTPLVCNDGVTIAKEFELEDAEEALGAQVLRQAAEKTGDVVGDGTSTSTVLAWRILAEGLRNVAAGASAVDLKRGLDRGMTAAVKGIRDLSRPVKSRKEKEQVATVSAHNDESIGKVVAEAIERVGSEGVVTVEEAKTTETQLDVVEGMQFDRGWISPYFVTDRERMEAVLEDPMILVTDRKIGNAADLVPILEAVAHQSRPLLIVAEDVDGDALATLLVNKLRGVLQVAAVKAPGYGDRRKEMLEDLAILTAGRVVSEDLGVKLDQAKPEMLGRAQRVVVAQEATTVVGGAGAKADIQGRIGQLRRQIEAATGDYDREKLRERLAKLSGGVAVIRVGAPSEAELKNRTEAFDDAVSSTRAAVAEGIVPGGGLALLRAVLVLDPIEASAEGDERTGVRILRRALEEPARQIAENSGADPGVVVDRMKSGKGAHGFDAATGRWVDLLEAGIIDPTKVVRVALENAVSVAGILLLTQATMTEIPAKPGEKTAPGIE
ncbi:MAG: chaperonin GroEL [Planctomycetia bacterium]|nr:chaperonin GroEL [Planctomycetia bacterium]